MLACVTGVAYFFREVIPPSVQMTALVSSGDQDTQTAVIPKKQIGRGAKSGASRKKPLAGQAVGKDLPSKKADRDFEDSIDVTQVVAGWVVITDPWGAQVNKFRAGLVGNGWLALPARACLGGNSWRFYADSGVETEISGGLWINGDEVGFWHLAENIEGPELAAWNKNEPVSWISLESANEYQSVPLTDGRAEGFFVSSSLPDYINEIGIFIQQGKVVGWSFGQWMSKGYLWKKGAGTDLEYKTWVRYFYDMTYANGREEQFAKALAMQKGYADLDQLAFFVKGFQLKPKLAAEDTPYYLLPETIIKQIRILVTNAVRRGEGSRVVDMFNSQVLKKIADISLLIDIVPVISAVRGYEAAINEIEGMGRDLVLQSGRDAPEIEKLHVHLYQDWLQSIVAAGDVDAGLQTFDTAKTYYPDDPSIHLLGVELSLLGSDWEEAERLLYMRDYPPAFQDRYQLLVRRVADMKGEEGRIVIRFPRGSNRIPVTAAINNSSNQDFIVDTGASMVTIPSSTAEELGLETVPGHRTLTTASGVVTVTEVIIDSIEIGGWVEYDVHAVVLDMPERPGLGLLGLNYLGRFQMDLKPESGTLLLNPR